MMTGMTSAVAIHDLHFLLWLAAAWIALGFMGMLRLHTTRFIAHLLFPLGAILCLGVALLAGIFLATGHAPQMVILPLGLPNLPFHARLDTLTGFFLLLLGLAGAGISIFAAGYFRHGQGTPPGLLCLQYHVFLASMALVILADDAYFFMVAWETMALSSYFLVTSQHRIAEIRRAGFLYLLMAHVGALCILLSFGVLQGGRWQFTFDAMRGASLPPFWASAAFLLALLGFGAKAGLVPLHVWLPEAHPAAPSPVSAMMSGLMLSTAVYGMLRISFDLLHIRYWWWGVLVLGVGLFSALFGAIFATVQTDMKRLLAYSSIENIGVIFTGIGLAILFDASHLPLFAALALSAALIHSLNHSIFKSLLFLATGSVLHATNQRSLGKLGGLIRSMPWVATLALVGTLAIAGLPPLNGFVSEWLLLQSFLYTPQIPHAFLNMLIPLGAAVLALTAALAAYVMVKFYGVIFLGQHREPSLVNAHDADWLERIGLAWLALGCIAIGVMPQLALRAAGEPPPPAATGFETTPLHLHGIHAGAGLEGEDRTTFFADVVPFAGWNAPEQRQRLIRVGMGGIQRFLIGEGQPTIHLVVECADRHGAVAALALERRFIQIACLGLINSIGGVNRPAGVATCWIGVEDSREGKTQLRKPSLRADGALWSNHHLAAAVHAEDHTGGTIF